MDDDHTLSVMTPGLEGRHVLEDRKGRIAREPKYFLGIEPRLEYSKLIC